MPGKDTFTRERMQKIAHLVDEELPAGWSFIVMAAPFNPADGRLNYVANGKREDVIKLLKNFLRHAEAGEFGVHSDKVV